MILFFIICNLTAYSQKNEEKVEKNLTLKGIFGNQIPGFGGSGCCVCEFLLDNGNIVWVEFYKNTKFTGLAISNGIKGKYAIVNYSRSDLLVIV